MPKSPKQDYRFQWKVEPFDLDDSSERYRALYSFSAATLNLATSLWVIASFLSVPNGLNRSRAQAVLDAKRLSPIGASGRDGFDALRESALSARELFLLSREAEAVRLPRTKRSKRYPRFFLTDSEGSALSQFKYGEFISEEVLQSAMTLIAGVLQLRDQVGAIIPAEFRVQQPGTSQPMADPASLAQQLTTSVTPDRHAIVAWLEEWLQNRTTSYRVHFNLACYFSREILAPVGGAENADEGPRHASLAHLGAALSSCPWDMKERLADQATRDPALIGLRVGDTGGFQDAVAAGGIAWQPTAIGATPNSADVQAMVLTTLVEDAEQAGRLGEDLVRMRTFAEGMSHADLWTRDNQYVRRLDAFMGAEPTNNDDSDRELLARLLFLSEWTGQLRRSEKSSAVAGDEAETGGEE